MIHTHNDHPSSRKAAAVRRRSLGAPFGGLGADDILTRGAETGDDTAARFVQAFADVWDRPTPEGMAGLMHPDVRLEAPMMNVTVGKAASLEEMTRLLLLWPDVRVEVERWSGSGDLVFIAFTMIATFAGRPLRIRGTDRIVLKDGLVIDRLTYVADPLSMLSLLLTRPSGWRRWWRSGVGFPRRRCRLNAGRAGVDGGRDHRSEDQAGH